MNNMIIPALAMWLSIVCGAIGTTQPSIDLRTTDYYHGSITNEFRRILDEGCPANELRRYVEKNNIPMQQMQDILLWFAKDSEDEGYGPRWRDRSIVVMGRLRQEEFLPYLLKQADQSNRKTDVIQSIIRIGGSKAVEFATSALSNTNFSRTDCRYIYENIMRHIMAESFEHDLVGKPSDEEKNLMFSYLIAEPRSTEKMEAVLRYDAHLSLRLPYQTNVERIAFLTYFSTNAPEDFRAEFIRRLHRLGQGLAIDASQKFPTISHNAAIPQINRGTGDQTTEIAIQEDKLQTQSSNRVKHLIYACASGIGLMIIIIIYLRKK